MGDLQNSPENHFSGHARQSKHSRPRLPTPASDCRCSWHTVKGAARHSVMSLRHNRDRAPYADISAFIGDGGQWIGSSRRPPTLGVIVDQATGLGRQSQPV